MFCKKRVEMFTESKSFQNPHSKSSLLNLMGGVIDRTGDPRVHGVIDRSMKGSPGSADSVQGSTADQEVKALMTCGLPRSASSAAAAAANLSLRFMAKKNRRRRTAFTQVRMQLTCRNF